MYTRLKTLCGCLEVVIINLVLQNDYKANLYCDKENESEIGEDLGCEQD